MEALGWVQKKNVRLLDKFKTRIIVIASLELAVLAKHHNVHGKLLSTGGDRNCGHHT